MWRKNYKNKTANEWTWHIYSCKQEFTDSNCTDFTTWKYKLDQGATEMFTPEFGNKESLFNVMSEIYKKGDAKKSKSQKVAWIIWDKR